MGLFGGYRADRLIAEVRESGDPTSAKAKSALTKLQGLGQIAIQPIVDALATSDKRETVAFVEALTPLIDNKSFPLIAKALAEENPRAVAGVAWALASARNYSPNLLLDLLQNPSVSKPAVLDVIASHKDRLNLRDLLNAAYQQDPNEKAALFRIAGELVDASSVDELIARVEGKDTIARTHIIALLARFDTPKVRAALQRTLKDPNKLVRAAALRAITTGSGAVDPALVAPLLRDSELDVQNPAIELLCRTKHPDTVRHLIDVLKDESEGARRAAVEVLNVVGDESSVKYLLKAIRDADWWVRSRAADALGKIGGPQVIGAALQLVSDKDDEVRRTAIEILNQTKDERALAHLIEATKDSDWWVSERAVDALGEMGNKKAVPRLMEMLKTNPKSVPTVVRALGKIGDPTATAGVMGALDRSETDIRIEGMSALARLADDRSVDAVRAKILPFSTLSDQSLAGAAQRALTELDTRFGGTSITSGAHTLTPAAAAARADQQRTMLIESADVSAIMKQAESLQRLDIATLKPGDVIEGRYKYIERIGRGAFGTVLLMEDTVVDERLVLKFLNPSISQDEEMMQRFVHELRYSRKITHPNVIRIYDFLHIRGNYAISMEYFPSHTLGGEVSGRQAAGAAPRGAARNGRRQGHVSRARSRHRAPRPQARERADQRGRHRQDRGLRRGRRPAPGRHPAHQDRLRDRLAKVHGARADPRQESGRARRHLLAGRDHVRDADRHPALPPRRPHVGHVPARAGTRPAAAQAQPRPARGSIRPRHEVHGGGQGEALRVHGRGECGAGTLLVIHSARQCRA